MLFVMWNFAFGNPVVTPLVFQVFITQFKVFLNIKLLNLLIDNFFIYFNFFWGEPRRYDGILLMKKK